MVARIALPAFDAHYEVVAHSTRYMLGVAPFLSGSGEQQHAHVLGAASAAHPGNPRQIRRSLRACEEACLADSRCRYGTFVSGGVRAGECWLASTAATSPDGELRNEPCGVPCVSFVRLALGASKRKRLQQLARATPSGVLPCESARKFLEEGDVLTLCDELLPLEDGALRRDAKASGEATMRGGDSDAGDADALADEERADARARGVDAKESAVVSMVRVVARSVTGSVDDDEILPPGHKEAPKKSSVDSGGGGGGGEAVGGQGSKPPPTSKARVKQAMLRQATVDGVTWDKPIPGSQCGVGRYQKLHFNAAEGMGGESFRSGDCADCPAGRYQQFTGFARCSACPSGQFAAVRGAARCNRCASFACEGHQRRAGCGGSSIGRCVCGKGRFKSKGSCPACPSGKYSGAFGDRCSECISCSASQMRLGCSGPASAGSSGAQSGPGKCICPTGKFERTDILPPACATLPPFAVTTTAQIRGEDLDSFGVGKQQKVWRNALPCFVFYTVHQ